MSTDISPMGLQGLRRDGSCARATWAAILYSHHAPTPLGPPTQTWRNPPERKGQPFGMVHRAASEISKGPAGTFGKSVWICAFRQSTLFPPWVGEPGLILLHSLSDQGLGSTYLPFWQVSFRNVLLSPLERPAGALKKSRYGT